MEYFIGLCDLDRDLISALGDIYGVGQEDSPKINGAILSTIQEHLFQSWSWTQAVKSNLVATLQEDTDDHQEDFEDIQGESHDLHEDSRHLQEDLGDLQEDFGGDKEAAYADILHWLSSEHGPQDTAFRVQLLDRQNPNFITELGETSIWETEFGFASEDAHYWETLARVYFLAHFSPGSANDVRTSLCWGMETDGSFDGTYEMWKLIHRLTLQRLRNHNAQLIFERIMVTPAFQDMYAFVEDSPRLKSISHQSDFAIRGRQKLDAPEESLNNLDDLNAAWLNEDSKEALYNPRCDFGSTQVVNDPRFYLHFIPKADLQAFNQWKSHMSQKQDEATYQIDGNQGWFLWSPVPQNSMSLHHLHTEDETHQYCLRHSFAWPSHFYNDKVVFRAIPLEESSILQDLKEYWLKWNDCAVTEQPETNKLLLLETIPGIKWRQTIKDHDPWSARTYFRNVIKAHWSSTSPATMLQDILGFKNYKPAYENLLEIIPTALIEDIQTQPLGEGVNGRVFAASWNYPAGPLETQKAQKKPIVLKQILSKYGEEEIEIKLIKELDTTFAALGGSSVGCVRLIGLANIPRERFTGPQDKLPPGLPLGTSNLQLVYERATEGTLFSAARKQLETEPITKSWDTTILALSSIAEGLNTLHKKNIMHRDLHPNNILATKFHGPTDPVTVATEIKYFVSDIGEGKKLSDRTIEVAGESIGAKQFRAPEIRGGRGWTVKADLFAFGVLACKILDLRARVCCPLLDDNKGKEEELDRKIPKTLMNILDGCLKPDPEQRPETKGVLDVLGGLLNRIVSGEVTMVIWDWNHALASAKGGDEDKDDIKGGAEGSIGSIFGSRYD